eukprot:1189572-Prorocentrum_minimum.AAC.3
MASCGEFVACCAAGKSMTTTSASFSTPMSTPESCWICLTIGTPTAAAFSTKTRWEPVQRKIRKNETYDRVGNTRAGPSQLISDDRAVRD